MLPLSNLNDLFKALADPTRRKLLDLLRTRDGRSLQDLCRHFTLSRFAVMKHLGILKGAGLVTVRYEGRHTLHYLNAVPLQRIADRWLSRYARRIAPALLDLKDTLEQGDSR